MMTGMNSESFKNVDAESQKERQPLVGKQGTVSFIDWLGSKAPCQPVVGKQGNNGMTLAVTIVLLCTALAGIGVYSHLVLDGNVNSEVFNRKEVESKRMRSTVLHSNPIAVIQTSMGEIEAEIFLKEMPITASNFLDLCNSGFYNGTHFHRVVRDFIVQLGDPGSKFLDMQFYWGMGAPKPYTKFPLLDPKGHMVKTITRSSAGNVEDEFTAKISNDEGTLAMANAGPQGGGSQFFINVKDNKNLNWFDSSSPSKHPVFGKVTDVRRVKGLLKQVAAVPTVPHSERPLTPIEVSCQVKGGLP